MKKKKLESRLRAAFLFSGVVGMQYRNAFARWAMLSLALLAGCASGPAVDTPQDVAATPWAAPSPSAASQVVASRWAHYPLPGKKPASYRYSRNEGRDALAVTAVASASMLRQKVRVEPEQLGRVRFSWKVPQLIAGADLGKRESADSPVRIILAFEGDRSRFSARDAMLSELARTLTGEEMPYATLMYVWCNRREPGSVIVNPRTDRIRKLVLESGPAHLNQWLDYERDIRADYRRVFGEEPGALVGVAIMTDSDNTRSEARAWYGPVRLVPTAEASAAVN
jgi:hypothetical protein